MLLIPALYGQHLKSYNIHSLIHLTESITKTHKKYKKLITLSRIYTITPKLSFLSNEIHEHSLSILELPI